MLGAADKAGEWARVRMEALASRDEAGNGDAWVPHPGG